MDNMTIAKIPNTIILPIHFPNQSIVSHVISRPNLFLLSPSCPTLSCAFLFRFPRSFQIPHILLNENALVSIPVTITAAITTAIIGRNDATDAFPAIVAFAEYMYELLYEVAFSDHVIPVLTTLGSIVYSIEAA